MKPIALNPPRDIGGHDVIFGAEQPQYLPLPAWTDGEQVIERWHLSWLDRLRAFLGGDLFVHVLTFGHPIQPIIVSFDWSDIDTAPETADAP